MMRVTRLVRDVVVRFFDYAGKGVRMRRLRTLFAASCSTAVTPTSVTAALKGRRATASLLCGRVVNTGWIGGP